mmetsp:Transcript_9144/g.19174  ORF Transcript_9144/g.19174 Transcript_9144/m.19174 type:complete len:201 (-) Transcript_9144:886-1488(-)
MESEPILQQRYEINSFEASMGQNLFSRKRVDPFLELHVVLPVPGAKTIQRILQFLDAWIWPRRVQRRVRFFVWFRKDTETVQGKEVQGHSQKFSTNRRMLDTTHCPFIYFGIPFVHCVGVWNKAFHLTATFFRISRTEKRVTIVFHFQPLVRAGIGNDFSIANILCFRLNMFGQKSFPKPLSNLIDPVRQIRSRKEMLVA